MKRIDRDDLCGWPDWYTSTTEEEDPPEYDEIRRRTSPSESILAFEAVFEQIHSETGGRP